MEFTLNSPAIFPVGTTVGVYAASGWIAGTSPTPGSAPKGAQVTSGVVGANGVTFAGLTEKLRYYAAGEVAGAYRYIAFIPVEKKSSGGGGGEESSAAYTPEKYGAKGDLKYVVDAGTTNASKVLTSATAAFTAADVGKTINIRGAGLAENKGMLTTTIAAVTNGTTIELAVASSATAAGKVAIWGTDDTEAIQKAINEAFAVGVASGSNFAEVKLAGRYMVAKAPTKGGATKGNAQITLPYVEPKKSKFVLVLKCPGRGAPLLHWHQVGPAIAGATLFSPLIAAAADGEWSVPSVIGGPTVLAADEGTLGFSNMLLEIDGALTILVPRRPNHMGMDLGLLGQCDLGSLAIIANATAVELKEDVDGNSFAANGEGIRMPKSGNNDLAKIDSLSLEGIPFGVGWGEHAHIERLAAIYCKTTVFVGPIGSVPTHGAYIGYWSQEACRNCLEISASAGGKYPMTVSRMDIEDTAGLSTDWIDANNALRGTVQWAQNESRAPTKSGAEHLKITDNNNTA